MSVEDAAWAALIQHCRLKGGGHSSWPRRERREPALGTKTLSRMGSCSPKGLSGRPRRSSPMDIDYCDFVAAKPPMQLQPGVYRGASLRVPPIPCQARLLLLIRLPA